MENTLERIAKCRYKTKMDKRSGFWQLDLTAAAHELLAFITANGRVIKWEGHAFLGGSRPGTLPRTDEQNVVHTEAQTSSTGVDFPRGRNGGPHG